jgi:hypothetical protein
MTPRAVPAEVMSIPRRHSISLIRYKDELAKAGPIRVVTTPPNNYMEKWPVDKGHHFAFLNGIG